MKRILASATVMIILSSAAVADQVTLSFPDVSELPIHSVEQAKAKANIIALIGGNGLKNSQGNSKNFLVTQRGDFIAAGLNFYLFPNRSEDEKASYKLRGSEERAARILNLTKEINKRNKLPIYLVGFSRGSVDAAKFSKLFPDHIKGIVLASGVYTNSSKKAEFYSMERILGSTVNVGVLVAHHEKDFCNVTPFSYAKYFFEELEAPRKAFLSYKDGGASGRECGPLNHHGFEDIQDRVANDIAQWIAVDSDK
jgi:pimeloyl-ACP methyl ester carboxylesterase